MEQPDLSAMDHAAKDDLIRFLLAENAELKSRITALEVRLAKDSHNSSKPPSSDGLRKPAPKSLRQAGQHPKGGQKGHKGATLERVEEPDQVIIHPLAATCDACGSSLGEAHVSEARQVFDIPPQQLEVTEHRVLEARCTCGKVHRSAFPEGVTATAQYGPRVQATVVYLTQHHMLPILRTARILRDTCGVALSPGAVVRMIHAAAGNLAPTVARIADAVRDAHVAHFDETGMRVAGKLHWLHAAATQTLTWVGIHTRRGQEAFDAFGILPGFQGTAIHDGWAPYRKYECRHGLCNAHHLRELTLIHEQHGQRWAKHMIDLLIAANREVADGPLTEDRMAQINADYTAILDHGDRVHPIKKRKDGSPQKGQSAPTNLLRRLRGYREDVLRFLSDPEVPFTNNIAEQAVRMPKGTSDLAILVYWRHSVVRRNRACPGR
ncbi:IS66 family transposase [Acidithiobacillus caldus]|uniref:IS66 family transposase n=1 Tax=Acidithiobacillus caldus TaxID=33059 RepID=UPI001C076BCA|nr:IS66 family transposase [Acidithiobacillus caldus]MBU2762882.1 IS66 family transposase [Acidithiobacillus caldus]